MANYVTHVEYVVGGSRVVYTPDDPKNNEIDDETLSAFIKIVDGKDIQDVIEDYI